MEISEVDETETFGLMFQLGEMGTFIIPIDLSDDYFENSWRDLSRVPTNTYFSPMISLVNYFVDEKTDKTLWVDNLSSHDAEKWGGDPEELFYSTIENPALFNEMTRDLLVEYQKYTH